MKISVNCPSYKRPKVETLNYIPFCKVWVDEKEYDEYVKNNIDFKENIIKVPSKIQGNVARIRNYILDSELKDNDVVVLMDDDIQGIYRFERKGNFGYDKIKIDEFEFYSFIEKYTSLCEDFGFKMWGVNCNQDAMSYRQTTPFSTISIVLGPFCCFLKGNQCRYDENLPLKEDYDIFIQNCNLYRGVLRVNKVVYDCKQSKQPGGCAVYRNYQREEEQLKLLQKKWGSKIVKFDNVENSNTKKVRKNIDYNPIIKIPIKGL